MTDFNKIRYRAVIEFLTLENVQPQQIHSRLTVVYSEDVPSYATVKLSFVEAAEALKVSPGRDVRQRLSAKKTAVLLKIW